MNILIQNSPFKFMNNLLFLNNTDIRVHVFNDDNDLYKTYFIVKPDIIILSSVHLTNNIRQFIEDVHNTTKIFIYHFDNKDSYIQEIINGFKNLAVQHITHYQIDNSIVIPNNLVNINIFNKNNISNRLNKIVCFLDGFKEIPSSINGYLYPNNNTPILLFNNPGIKHPQNLGVLAEPHKGQVLQSHQYYLSCDALNDYTNEAVACGCCVLKVEDLKSYENKNIDEINNNYVTYEEFLTGVAL
jgi:hypothetical protein